jgi:DNA-directed RNA polymerase specialized sigma24 family protein
MAPGVSGQVGYQAALAQLPEAHALALRLTDSGASDEEICGGLGIEPESLEPLLELARRKLHAKMSEA